MTHFDKVSYDNVVLLSAKSGRRIDQELGKYKEHNCEIVTIPFPNDGSCQHRYYFARDMDYYPIRWELQDTSDANEIATIVRNETLQTDEYGDMLLPAVCMRYQDLKDGVWQRAKYIRVFYCGQMSSDNITESMFSCPRGTVVEDDVAGVIVNLTGKFTVDGPDWMDVDSAPTLFRAHGYTLAKLMNVYKDRVRSIPRTNTP